MNDGQALYKAICENPDEDTPRLVYADWLEEQGEHEYAQYIRWNISIVNPPDEESFENVLDWGERERWCREYEARIMDIAENVYKKAIDIEDEEIKDIKTFNPSRMWKLERGFPQGIEYFTSDIFLPGMYNVRPREGTYWTHLAERLMRETPVTCLMLADVEPFRWLSHYRPGRSRPVAVFKYRWSALSIYLRGDVEAGLELAMNGVMPEWLFDLAWYSPRINTLHKQTVMTQSQTSTRYIEFDTREQAKEALGEVLGRDIRERVYGRKK